MCNAISFLWHWILTLADENLFSPEFNICRWHFVTSAKKHWCWVGQIYFFQCFGNHKPSSVCFHDIPWLFALAPLSSSSFKAPVTPASPASKLCRSNLRIKLRKVHRTRWHLSRNLKTDCRCRLPAAEGGGVGDWTAVIVPSREWQQQDDHLIFLKLGSSIGPSLISGSVFVLCHSYLMDVQQSEGEAKGFI